MSAARSRTSDDPLSEALEAVRRALDAVARAAADLGRAPDGPVEPLLAAVAARDRAWSTVGRLVAGPLLVSDRLVVLPDPDPTPIPSGTSAADPMDPADPMAPADPAAPSVPTRAPDVPGPPRGDRGPSPALRPADPEPASPRVPRPSSSVLASAGMPVRAGSDRSLSSSSSASVAAPAGSTTGPPATRESLAALVHRFASGAHLTGPPPEPDLLPFASVWGAPEPLDLGSARAAVPVLEAATTSLGAWLTLPVARQQGLLAYAVARLRQVQETLGYSPGEVHTPLTRSFSTLTTWSREHRPGKVRGLARADEPRRGSWLEDARAAWAALGLQLAPEAPVAPRAERPSVQDLDRALDQGVADEVLRALVERLLADPEVDPDQLVPRLSDQVERLTGRGLKPLRKRIARARRARDRASEAALEPSPESPWGRHCAGRRGAVVGGDGKARTRERLKSALGFADLRWETGLDPRRIETLVERIESGTVDLVLVACRWLSHSASDRVIAACQRAGVRFVMLDTGFGLDQVRRAIAQQMPGA